MLFMLLVVFPGNCYGYYTLQPARNSNHVHSNGDVDTWIDTLQGRTALSLRGFPTFKPKIRTTVLKFI